MIPEERPQVEHSHALKALDRHYGLSGCLSDLPGDRDRNFLLATEEGKRFVVKVSSPHEPLDTLRFETEIVALVNGQTGGLLPDIVPALDGRLLVEWSSGDTVPSRSSSTTATHPTSGARRSFLRVIQHVPGRLLADFQHRPRSLIEDVGRRLGHLSKALATVPEHPPARKDFGWALANAGLVMERALPLLEGDRLALVTRTIQAFEQAGPRYFGLGSQIIHGDVNDHNVIVSSGDDGEPSVAAIIDLGDAHSAPRVFDLAIAIAYAIFDVDDPLLAAAALVRGFHREQPLLEAEINVAMTLTRARLGQSVAMSALRRRAGEPDDYHLVSEASAWSTLALLDSVPDPVATGLLRDACGLEPCPGSDSLRAWLADTEVHPVIDMPASTEIGVLDLSVGSLDLTGRDTDDPAEFDLRMSRVMAREGWKVGVGRYLEPRAFYLTEAFAGRPGDPTECRTVHLGIDLFVEAGTEVRAPLAGRVASVRDNNRRLDYGPTVIVEHEGGPVGTFWTLYGHLERASVADLVPGARLDAGETFARVGTLSENGGWPPHLHFQIVADLAGVSGERHGDFPGVALPRERAVWASLSPDPNLLLRLPCDTRYEPRSALADRRRKALGGNLSVSYRDPIHVVRGRAQYLYDDWGRKYLDCVNNPAHVGHEHPRVVRAGSRQMVVLNTNTRYLHSLVIEYAERLAHLLPDRLSLCWFVNSGSEANELALRIAHAHTGARGIVVLEGGYHGHTTALIGLSHYKRPDLVGRDEDGPVRAVPMPDSYRGLYRENDPDRASRYAAHVAGAVGELVEGRHGVAAFLAEAVMSCGGQIEFPEGFLPAAYAAVRAAGAVCIADEVQIGFGRMGSHAWGFEAAGAVPDIVTLGKPMGNGHPIGAVVTTPEVAASFVGGIEFFSTFGGNPVSAAIGLAVLDVINDEELQRRALNVGQRLRNGLAELAERHEPIGDVRGRGLFQGFELVRDRDSREPDPDLATRVVEAVRKRGVLLSTDGPDANVIKIKPPMVFSKANADRAVEEVDRALGQLVSRRPS